LTDQRISRCLRARRCISVLDAGPGFPYAVVPAGVRLRPAGLQAIHAGCVEMMSVERCRILLKAVLQELGKSHN